MRTSTIASDRHELTLSELERVLHAQRDELNQWVTTDVVHAVHAFRAISAIHTGWIHKLMALQERLVKEPLRQQFEMQRFERLHALKYKHEAKPRACWGDDDDDELPQMIGSSMFAQVQVMLQGKTQMIVVTSFTTGTYAKQLIQKKTGVSAAQLGSLYFRGRLIDDACRLVSYGVVSGSTVEIKARLRGGADEERALINTPVQRLDGAGDVSRRSLYGDTPQHIQRLEAIEGIGPMKRKLLLNAFDTEDALRNASQADLAAVPTIGRKLAKLVHDFVHAGTLPPSRWRSQPRVTMWDTKLKRKLSGAVAPEDNDNAIKTWLANREKGRYERYSEQDLVLIDTLHIPPWKQMSSQIYSDYFVKPTDNGSDGRLDANLFEHGLKRQVVGQGPISLMSALVVAASQLNEVSCEDRLRSEFETLIKRKCTTQMLSPDALTPEMAMKMLEAAHAVFKRPVWVWTGNATTQSVFVVNSEHIKATRVTPLRLAQAGSSFAPVVERDGADLAALALQTEARRGLEDAEGLEDADRMPLQDLKENIKSALQQFLALIREIVEWSEEKLDEPINLSGFEADCQDLLDKFDNSDGLYAALLGDNGIGKSTLISLLVFLSLVDEETYEEHCRDAGYMLEAFSRFDWRESPPTLHEVLGADGSLGGSSSDAQQPPVRVELIANELQEEAILADHRAMVEQLGRYCEGKSCGKPEIKRTVLEVDKNKKTTARNVKVPYGKVMHILAMMFSVAELQTQGFEFVLALIALGNNNAKDLPNADKKQLLLKWRQYKRITEGIVKDDELEDACVLHQLPKVDELPRRPEDVHVFPELAALCRTPAVVFVCAGGSLREHQRLVHDQMVKLNDPESLYRVAMKTCENFQPACILENGNGFVDCPGLNDTDDFCTHQTICAVREAGVLLILLRRSLKDDENVVGVLEKCAARALQRERPLKVVFVLYREALPGFDPLTDIGSPDESQAITKATTLTRTMWFHILKEANEEANAHDKRTSEEELRAMAEATEIRAVYPMIHASLMLNRTIGKTGPELVERIESQSNVCWLLGLVDALNRDALVASFEHLVMRRLPEMSEQLRGSLDGAEGGSVPEQLVRVATTLLNASKKGDRMQTFANTLSGLEKKVEQLVSEGTSAGESVKARVVEKHVQAFLSGGNVEEMLAQAAKESEKGFEQLKQKLQRAQTAQAAVHPKYKGAYHNGEIVPLVLGSKHGEVTVDFKPLIEELARELDDFHLQIVGKVLETVDEIVKTSDTSFSSVAQLRDTYLEHDVVQSLAYRCSIEKFFTTKEPGRSHLPASLQRGDITSYLKRVVAGACADAVHDTILCHYATCTNATSVHKLIRDNLPDARERWKEKAEDALQSCLDRHFRLLLSDLTGGQKKFSLLKKLLVGFLQHVVRTSAMQRDDSLQSELLRYVNDIQVNINMLHSLFTRLIRQDDPIPQGKAAMRRFERTMFRKQTFTEASSMITCTKIPMCPMPTMIQPPPNLKQHGYDQRRHMFSVGDVNQVSTLCDTVRRAPFGLVKGGVISGYSDLFFAVAQLLWTDRQLLKLKAQPSDTDVDSMNKSEKRGNRNNRLQAVADQLRTLTVADMANYYRKEERCSEFREIAGEDSQVYLSRLRDERYPGDAHCLWILANTFKVSFRLWLPGHFIVMVSCSGKKYNGPLAYNLMLTADLVTDQPKAPSYKPRFYPMLDTRRVHFSSFMP